MAVTALGRIAAKVIKRAFTAKPDKRGRTHFRINGVRVKAQTYLRELRRGPGGQFRSAVTFLRNASDKSLEQYLLGVFKGSPIGGGNWVARVQKSADRFADVLAGANQL